MTPFCLTLTIIGYISIIIFTPMFIFVCVTIIYGICDDKKKKNSKKKDKDEYKKKY